MHCQHQFMMGGSLYTLSYDCDYSGRRIPGFYINQAFSYRLLLCEVPNEFPI